MNERSPYSNYSPAIRGRIIGMLEAGKSVNEVALRIGCNVKTVRLWRDKFRAEEETGLADHRKNNQRPKKTTPDEDRELIAVASEHPFESVDNLLARTGLPVARRTAHRRLNAADVVCRVAAKKPELEERHIQQRLVHARDHLAWTQEQWDQVIWSDEKSFSTKMDGRLKVWRPKGARLDPRFVLPDHYSSRVTTMYWGCMCATGLMALQQVSAHMNGEEYCEVLEETMLPAARQVFPEEENPTITFMHDNAAVHTSFIVRDWLIDHPEVILLPHPAKSPDLNPIENIWGIMTKQWLPERRLRTRDELQDFVQTTWENLS